MWRRPSGTSQRREKRLLTTHFEFERAVREQPNEGPPLCMLGLTDAGLGRKEEAIREGRRVSELTQGTKDAIEGAEIMNFSALSTRGPEGKIRNEQIAATLQVPSG